MIRLLAIALAVLAAVAGLEWHGHRRGVADTTAAAERKVEKAQADTALATAERDAALVSLDNVKRTLAAQKSRLELANLFADAALSAREALQKKLQAATAARDTVLRKAAHDSPDCADLARLPVCPAVAERLWGEAASDPPDPGH
ncbi:MAG: hypothetical protein WA961_14655 [Rhodanobacter sp.]